MKNRVKPNARAARSSATLSEQTVELPDRMRDCIAKKAYELYEQRGRRDGYALQDWLDAEEIVTEEIHEALE